MDKELKKIVYSAFFPFLFVFVLWIIKGIELYFELDFSDFGILPLNAKGLRGVIFSPLLHGDLKHLMSNTAPLLVLGWGLFYFYRRIAYPVFFLSWLITGIWVWAFARENFHIGASTIVYSLAAFHIASALIRREKSVLAFMLLVFFLYGSMIWGFFPDFFPNRNISWEGHLMGSLAGIVLAVFYRKEGPQRYVPDWEEDEDDDELSDEDPYWLIDDQQEEDPRNLNVRYRYHYRPNPKDKKSKDQ
ncbi:MAG: rhomboid family intramembrane serine protease [Bacteroidales bacterium]|nr:rhomboid family intramembrane serine protease [Bacteroidales bacterium]MCF8327350.1 rhomboid family intramembrane serine protease [Bacteroidales bacterium]